MTAEARRAGCIPPTASIEPAGRNIFGDPLIKRLREWAYRLKRDIVALWFCTRHPETPLPAKVIALAVVAYAFSPIDLVPDFIPVLGVLDDLILLPAGIWLVLKLVPDSVLEECRGEAARWLARGRATPRSRLGALAIVLVWVLVLWFAWRWAETWLMR